MNKPLEMLPPPQEHFILLRVTPDKNKIAIQTNRPPFKLITAVTPNSKEPEDAAELLKAFTK